MIAIIFEVFPKSSKKDEYLRLAAEMRSLVDQIEGFISVERFQSITNPNKLLSISLFENEAAVDEWRNYLLTEKCNAKEERNSLKTMTLKLFKFFVIIVCWIEKKLLPIVCLRVYKAKRD